MKNEIEELGRRGAKERREITPAKRINLTVRGEPSQWLEEWIRRGLCNSVTDAVLLAFQTLHERITDHDIKEEQLKMLRDSRYRGVEVREGEG